MAGNSEQNEELRQHPHSLAHSQLAPQSASQTPCILPARHTALKAGFRSPGCARAACSKADVPGSQALLRVHRKGSSTKLQLPLSRALTLVLCNAHPSSYSVAFWCSSTQGRAAPITTT